MKKLFATLFVVASVFSVIGCSKAEEGEKAPPIDAAKDLETKKEGGSAPSATQD